MLGGGRNHFEAFKINPKIQNGKLIKCFEIFKFSQETRRNKNAEKIRQDRQKCEQEILKLDFIPKVHNSQIIQTSCLIGKNSWSGNTRHKIMRKTQNSK